MLNENMIFRGVELMKKGGFRELSRGLADEICKNIQGYTKHDRTVAATLLKNKYGRYYEHQLPGYALQLDLNDPGISTELAFKGIRERRSYWEYRNQLSKLNELKNEINVIEAGANIGYYALAAWAELDNPNIFAVEMLEQNIKKLVRNIKLNNASDSFEVDQLVLGKHNETVNINYLDESNLSFVTEHDEGGITSTSLINYIESKCMNPQDVDVLRMDVEGFEHAVLDSADVLSPAIVHIEYHPHKMNSKQIQEVLSILKSWNLNLVCASGDHRNYDVQNLTKLSKGRLYELVLVDTRKIQ